MLARIILLFCFNHVCCTARVPPLNTIADLPAYAATLSHLALEKKDLIPHEKMVCSLIMEYAVIHTKKNHISYPKMPDFNFLTWLPSILTHVIEKLQSGWLRLPGIENISITRTSWFNDEDCFYTALFDLAGISDCKCFERILPCGTLMLTINIPESLVNDFDAFFGIQAVHEVCIDIAPEPEASGAI
jgi:hypothetical protein